jgi:hypothetical protein
MEKAGEDLITFSLSDFRIKHLDGEAHKTVSSRLISDDL